MSRIDDSRPEEVRQDEEGFDDPRVGHRHPDDRPIADLLEQEVPVPVDGASEDSVGNDDDRVEPFGTADWYETEPVEPGPEDSWSRSA